MITTDPLYFRSRSAINLITNISGSREGVEYVSANHMPRRSLLLSDRLEKQKFGRGRWDLAACEVSFNSVHRLRRRSQISGQGGHLRLPICKTKNHKFGRGRSDHSYSLSRNSIRRLQRKSRKISQLIRGKGGYLGFPVGAEKYKQGRGHSLSPVVECRSAVAKKMSKNVSANPGLGRPSWLSDRPEDTNLEVNVETLLPVKIHWVLFSGCKNEIKNVAANYRPGRPLWFSDPHEKHKLGRLS